MDLIPWPLTTMSTVKPVPEGVPAIMPMLVCRDAAAEMDFCESVFGAVELNRRPGPDGRVAHGLVAIRGAMVMIEAEWHGSRAPEPDGSSPVVLYVYVENVDAAVARAITAGASLLMPVEDRFWGDRTGRILDPAGHVWTIATRVEEPAEEERQARWSKLLEERSHAGEKDTR